MGNEYNSSYISNVYSKALLPEKKVKKKKKKKNSSKYKKHYTFLQKEYLTVWYATVPTSIFLIKQKLLVLYLPVCVAVYVKRPAVMFH